MRTEGQSIMSVLRCICEDVAAVGVGCLTAPALSAVCVLTLHTSCVRQDKKRASKREGASESKAAGSF